MAGAYPKYITLLCCLLYCKAVYPVPQIYAYGEGPEQQVTWYPAAPARVACTILFVDSRRWASPSGTSTLPQAIITDWQARGINTAIIRHRNPPARFPAQIEDLLAAVAKLADTQPQLAGTQIYLMGRDSGAYLAALAVMHPEYRKALDEALGRPAGVIALSGIYNLDPPFPLYEGQIRRRVGIFGDALGKSEVSPAQLAASHGDVPFLLLSAENDISGYPVDARIFAKRLREGGATVYNYIVPEYGHDNLIQLHAPGNPAADIILRFIGHPDADPALDELLRVEDIWQQPPYDLESFWQAESLIVEYPMESDVRRHIERVFRDNRYRLAGLRFETYSAIPLAAWLERQFPGNTDRYLVTTNTRNEKYVWDLKDIQAYDPVIVIGIDDVRNPFRLSVFYQALREYSWQPQDEPPPVMARSLGAFIYFRRKPPARWRPRFQAQFSLTAAGFGLSSVDPLGEFRDLDPALFGVLTHVNGCVSCHTLRSVGSRAHHIHAERFGPSGGFALPLESYPPQVWQSFVYRQEEVAAKIGTTPNRLHESVRDRLYHLVNAARR